MIQFIFLSFFSLLCVLGARSAALAAAIVLLMFPLEQVMQSAFPYLRTSVGAIVVNAIVAVVATIALVSSILRGQKVGRGSLNRSAVACIGLFAWATVTVVWSPAKETAMKGISEGLPYLFLHVVIGPMLFNRLDDLVRCCRYLLVVGIFVGLGFIGGSEFLMRNGRLVLDFGGGAYSAPLAVGEFGGSLLIVAALAHGGAQRTIWTILRLAGLGVGLAVALKSGSRGQFVFAVPVAMLFVPVAAPVKNLRNFLAATLLVTGVLISADFLFSNILASNDAKRFTVDSMLYGSSSVSGRFNNVVALALEWLSNPFSLLFGTGYSAFAILPEAGDQEYSHVLFADALFELGIPGALLLGVCLSGAIGASRALFRIYRNEPGPRSAVASFMALGVYQVLLVNKQGSLWSVPLLFFVTSTLARLASRVSGDEGDGELQLSTSDT
jgi:hypothetical protein